jgi:hypothetical protein
LFDFAIHHRRNETRSRRSTSVKKCVFTVRCHVADWCNRLVEVWPWHPLSSSFTETVTTITVWGLSDTTSYVHISNSAIVGQCCDDYTNLHSWVTALLPSTIPSGYC